MNPFSRKGPDVPPPPSAVATPQTDADIVAGVAKSLADRIATLTSRLNERLASVSAPRVENDVEPKVQHTLASQYFNGVYVDLDSTAVYLDEIEDLLNRLAI